MPAPHPAYFGRDALAQAGAPQGRSFAELSGATTGRDSDRYRAPLAKLEPPIKRPWGQLFLWTVGFGMSLVGFIALVLIVAEASNG